MKNLSSKLVTLFLVIIGVLVILLIRSEFNSRNSKIIIKEYQKEIKKINIEIDSLKDNNKVLEVNYKNSIFALEKADKEVIKTKKALEKVKNTPPIRYTDAELDSILTAYYPR